MLPGKAVCCAAGPPNKSCDGTIIYKVCDRDTLRSIAVRFNTTPSTLMKLNHLHSAVVFPEQILMVPECSAIESDENYSEDVNLINTSFHSEESKDSEFSFLAPLSPTQHEMHMGAEKHEHLLKKMGGRKTSYDYTDLFNWTSASELLISNDKHNVDTELAPCDDGKLFEEKFLKIVVSYFSPKKERVKGVLLVTPESVMFDPDSNDAVVVANGREEYGIMCNLSLVSHITMYHCVESPDPADTSSSEKTKSAKAADPAQIEPPDKLMAEFPLLHSIMKNIEGRLHISLDSSSVEDDGKSNRRKLMCVHSKTAMKRTFSSNADDDEAHDDDHYDQQSTKTWFEVPGESSDQLLAFFLQWGPDPFAEERGFVVVDSVNTSATSLADAECEVEFSAPGVPRIKVDWEVVRHFETKVKRSGGAEDRATPPSSDADEDVELPSDIEPIFLPSHDDRREEVQEEMVTPELSCASCLLTDATLRALSEKLPAMAMSEQWKLLYSTFEHGMSLRTLYRSMTPRGTSPDKDMPVVFIVQDTHGYVFGAFCSCQPRVSEHFYGTGETFVFTLEPELRFYPWTGDNMFFIKGDQDALTFGGGDGECGLWIDGDLLQGNSHHCQTFDNQPLSHTTDFQIQGVEVWATHAN